MKDYVNFHTHTTFSLMDSLIKPSELFKRVKELGQSAVSVTDHSSIAGAWDCLKYSKEAGVKLIIGCEFYFTDDVSDPKGRLRHVILVAKNAQGYKNLLALSKAGYDNLVVMWKKAIPRIDWKMLEKYSEGLICTTACGGGILAQLINTRKLDEAKKQAVRLKDIFGINLALEIQPHAMKRVANVYKDYEDQRFTNYQLIKIGRELDIKVIAAVDAHYVMPEDHEAHDVMLAIASGQPVKSGNRLKYINEFHIKSRDEVIRGISGLGADPEEFCDNTLFFSEMCEQPDWIDPKFSNPTGRELPDFDVAGQLDYNEFLNWKSTREDMKEKREDVAYLRYLCELELPQKTPPGKEEEYRTRLEEELDVFEYQGFSSYMLIVADYLKFCRDNGIAVSAGRGSCGGSIVAYLLKIHIADPIKYKLIFARFQNKLKASMPDIDSDIAPSGRDRLHQYIKEKYGEDRVAHVSNVMTMTPKVYAKNISRTFIYGGDPKAAVAIGNSIADSIPKEIKYISDALKHAPLFAEYANSEKYHHLSKYADQLGSKATAWSTHAGGVVIGKRPLVEIVPLRRDKDGAIALEYEKERAEANGLVKMDTLGLTTLDIFTTTHELIKRCGKEVPPSPPPFDDPPTYDLISRGDTLCVFQLGTSGGTIELCKKVKPKTIEDISLVNALARPSAKDMREDFVAVRNGEKPIQLLHPRLERAFNDTYGFGLFEECLMFLAQDVAGWDLHSADRLRKLTKEKGKNPKKAAEWRQEFIDDATKNGVETEMATKIWDEVVSNFAGYGFNASHSVLYSMISYESAYLKTHYPLEFLTANLISEAKSNAPSAKDNINRIKNEIRKLKINIVPPDINKSDQTYTIKDANTLVTGFDALKYMGKDAIPEILAKRPFANFEDFLTRCDSKKVKAPAIQALAASGALDSFKMTRKQMYLYASDYKKKLQVWLKRKKKENETFNYPWPNEKEDWIISERYALERYYIGEGLSGNKIQAYPGFFDSRAIKFSTLAQTYPDTGEGDSYNLPGSFQAEIISFFEFKVKKEDSKSFGKLMAKVLIEDPFGTQIVMTVFAKQWSQLKERIKVLTKGKQEFEPGIAIKAVGTVSWYEGEINLIFQELLDVAPPPPVPADLKPKKVSMRMARSSKKLEEMEEEELIEHTEDEIVEDGFSQSDDEPEDIDPTTILDVFN